MCLCVSKIGGPFLLQVCNGETPFKGSPGLSTGNLAFWLDALPGERVFRSNLRFLMACQQKLRVGGWVLQTPTCGLGLPSQTCGWFLSESK